VQDVSPTTDSETNHNSRWFLPTESWLISLVVHLVALIALALWMLPTVTRELDQLLVLGSDVESDELEELEAESIDDQAVEVQVEVDAVTFDQVDEPIEVEAPSPPDLAAAGAIELAEFGVESTAAGDLLASVGAHAGTGLDGRSAAGRAALVRKYGGSKGSEAAVALGLKWLAEHQYPDGSWRFDHAESAQCQGRCRHPGTIVAPTGATALGLLPFLAAGHTHHKKGKYQQVVGRGLGFLVNQMQVGPQGGSLESAKGGDSWKGGSMYCHGLASLALLEAYGMTKDPALRQPAQLALQWIISTQDSTHGGWPYHGAAPKVHTISLAGWQIMALKSARMSGLEPPQASFAGAAHYLSQLQHYDWAYFRYRHVNEIPDQPVPSCTAIGLLCSMVLGRDRYDHGMQTGVRFLDQHGPALDEPVGTVCPMYYNYYATQVMFHWSGPEWERWNKVMRDHLVNTQNKQGHEAGSWYEPFFPLKLYDTAGRLYMTAMCIMTLEVYYRYLPMYSRKALEDDFPLD